MSDPETRVKKTDVTPLRRGWPSKLEVFEFFALSTFAALDLSFATRISLMGGYVDGSMG